MSEEQAADGTISKHELTEALAEATDSTPEEIEAGAESFEIGPPWDAEIVDRE